MGGDSLMTNRSENPPIHYGWVIVLAGGLTLFSCLGLARFAFGMLLPSMGAGLGLGFDEMGFISTGNFAGYLASVALAPFLIRRFKPRATIVAGLLLITLSMLGISRSNGFLPILILYAVVGVGSGFANIPVMALVSHWFRRNRRGRAAGLMITGNGTAIIFAGYLIPALNRHIGSEGWRTGWLLLGIISLVIAATAAFLIRNDPSDLGLEPIGTKEPIDPGKAVAVEAGGAGGILVKLGLLYSIFGATYVIYGTFIVTTMVTEYGFPETRAGMFWSWVGFFSLFSGVGFGTLSDRIGRKRGLATVFGVQTVAYMLAGSGLGTGTLLCSVVLYGLSAFAIPTIMAAAVGDYLGLNRAASGFAAVTLFFAMGQTLGPAAAGILAETAGTFSPSYLGSAILTGAAMFLATRLPKPGTAG